MTSSCMPPPADLNHRSTPRSLHVSSGEGRRVREYELYQHSSGTAGGRSSSDGPFSLSSVQGHRYGQGWLAWYEGSALRTADRSTEGVSPSASENGLVFWDEAAAQPMYPRLQEATEIPTEAGSLSDDNSARRYTATPQSQAHGQSVAALPCTRSARERPDTGTLLHYKVIALIFYAVLC
jgi:hypothetical protein